MCILVLSLSEAVASTPPQPIQVDTAYLLFTPYNTYVVEEVNGGKTVYDDCDEPIARFSSFINRQDILTYLLRRERKYGER
jgi:hypothetical protein